MSIDPSDIGQISSREDVERVLASLAARIEDLEAREERKDERIDHLERELQAEREQRQALEEAFDAHKSNVIGDIVDLESALDDLTSQPVEIDDDQALAIQQVRRTQKIDASRLSANERRAGTLWGAFPDEWTTTPSKHTLDSSTVRTILAVAEDGQPHDEDVRRAMRLLEDLGGEYVDLVKRNGQLTLVIDREPWEAYLADVHESLGRTDP